MVLLSFLFFSLYLLCGQVLPLHAPLRLVADVACVAGGSLLSYHSYKKLKSETADTPSTLKQLCVLNKKAWKENKTKALFFGMGIALITAGMWDAFTQSSSSMAPKQNSPPPLTPQTNPSCLIASENTPPSPANCDDPSSIPFILSHHEHHNLDEKIKSESCKVEEDESSCKIFLNHYSLAEFYKHLPPEQQKNYRYFSGKEKGGVLLLERPITYNLCEIEGEKEKTVTIKIAQIPGLQQDENGRNPNNYCGYYALYHALECIADQENLYSVAEKIAGKKEAKEIELPRFDRAHFLELFKEWLEIVNVSNNDHKADMSMIDILLLQEIIHETKTIAPEWQIEELRKEFERVIDAAEVQEGEALVRVIKDFLSQLYVKKEQANPPANKRIYLVNRNGHWLTLFLAAVNNQADSLEIIFFIIDPKNNNILPLFLDNKNVFFSSPLPISIP